MANVPIESSFARILNRTQQNLNRINQRYAPPSNNRTGSTATSASLISLQDPNSLLRDRLAGKDLTNIPNSHRPSSSMTKTATNSITINEDILRDILERITTLESKKGDEQSLIQRVERLEKLLSNHDSGLDHLTYESKDLQRQTSHLQSRISNMELLYESNKSEHESRRASNVKIDHWIKAQDHWRDDVERLTTQLRKDVVDFKHDKQDYQQRLQQVATKQEVDQIKDKLHLLTQQSISVAISAWTETADHKIRQLERELALLKMGQSSAVQKEILEKTGGLIPDESSSEHTVTAEMIAKALDASTPSETLVKGMVAAEILQMQTSLENKLDRQLQQNLSSALVEAKGALASQFEQQILAIGLMESVGPTAFNIDASDSFPSSTFPTAGTADADIARLRREFDRRVMLGRSKLDQLEKQLQDRVTNLSETLYRLQNSYETSDKTNTASLALLQQRLEAVVHQNESLAQTSLSRNQRHEQMLQQLDEKFCHQLQVKSEDTFQRLQETVQDFQETRLLLEHRLLPLEQSTRDWLHELRHQQDRIMTSITSHPAFVEATKIATNLEVVTKEVRENATNVLKMQAQVCWQKDFTTLNEKVSRMDHIVHQKSPEYFALTTKLLDTTQQLTGRVQHIEHSSQMLLSETDLQRRRMESTETTSLQTLSRVNVLHEELQLTKQRLENHEQAYQRDHTALKDLAGSVATRVQSVEGKIHILQRTQETEVNALRQQIKMVDEKVVHLDQSFQTLLINMTFQKATVPPAIPVAEEKVLVMSKRPPEQKTVDDESYERILTPRKPTTVTNFETSPLSEENEKSMVKTTSRTHLVDIIYDHPVEKMSTPPISTQNNRADDGSDNDESSVASTEDEEEEEYWANTNNTSNSLQSMNKYDRSDSGDVDDCNVHDNKDVHRIEAKANDVHHIAVNFTSVINKYDENDIEDESDEDDDNQRDSGYRSATTKEGSSAINSSNNVMEDSASSFFSDKYSSPPPVKSITAQSVEKSNAVTAFVPPASAHKANMSNADIEEFDTEAFDDSHSIMSLPSPAGKQHSMSSSSVLSPAISKPTVFTNSNNSQQQLTPQHKTDDASFSDWDASMDEESTAGLGGSASSPWVNKTTNVVTAGNTKPIQQSDTTKDDLIKPENRWNNYVSEDNSSTSAIDEDNDADESQRQSHSHLQPGLFSGDQNSLEISSFDRRQITLDISDSSIDDRSSSGKQIQSSPNIVVEKKKSGILDGLSDEDSCDLSYDYQKSQGAKAVTTSSIIASAIVNTLPIVNTGTPATISGLIAAAKPKILEGLSDDESSDESFFEKKKQQQQNENEKTAVSAHSLAFTFNTVQREETIFSPSSSSATVPPVVPTSSTPATSVTTPLTASGSSGFAPVVSSTGLTARERLRLRQEQMRVQRTTSSSTNVSVVPSAVVSGANSPVHSPASPVNVPQVTSTITNNINNSVPVTNKSNNSDGVMSFEDDEFENSFDT